MSDVVKACRVGSIGLDLTVGVSSEGKARVWVALLEDRVTLPDEVGLGTVVLNKRSARAFLA